MDTRIDQTTLLFLQELYECFTQHKCSEKPTPTPDLLNTVDVNQFLTDNQIYKINNLVLINYLLENDDKNTTIRTALTEIHLKCILDATCDPVEIKYILDIPTAQRIISSNLNELNEQK